MRPTITDEIQRIWGDFLAWLSTIVIPDWSAIIALIPLLLLLGLIGPLLTLAVLAWLGYGITKPRTVMKFVEGTRTAPLDHLGKPIFRRASRTCPARRADLRRRRDPLRPGQDAVRSAARSAAWSATPTSGPAATGQYLRVESRTLIAATDGPPPGGAAVA